MERFKPKTINLRIQAINKYLAFVGKQNLQLEPLKIQQKTYLENVISNADYTFLKKKLRADKDENEKWYFIVRFLGATGARISELVRFKVEHIQEGHFDLYTKGGKIRRLLIPKSLNDEAKEWLKRTEVEAGYLFLDDKGAQIGQRLIRHRLQRFAKKKKYGLEPKVMHPHSFRHLYAKNFLAACHDISLLADLMGHESIETTRIYLRKTAGEQKALVDEIITW